MPPKQGLSGGNPTNETLCVPVNLRVRQARLGWPIAQGYMATWAAA